jgi:hypothetical protein
VRIVIGSYRGPDLVLRAIASLQRYMTGWDDTIIVDDSGNLEWMQTYARLEIQYPDGTKKAPFVVSTGGRRGYNLAMKQVCRWAGDRRFMFWEEDFELLVPTDLNDMDQKLFDNPHLAQLALLRGSHFENEFLWGGLLPALNKRIPGSVAGLDPETGIIEQTGTFTCNPAVWQRGVAKMGWPNGSWSEDRKRDDLIKQGYKFGFLPEVRVTHNGIRSGFDY